jgi:hypothetical protein
MNSERFSNLFLGNKGSVPLSPGVLIRYSLALSPYFSLSLSLSLSLFDVRFDNRREEIEAFVKASVSEVFNDLNSQSSLTPSSNRLTSQSPPPQTVPRDSSVVKLGKMTHSAPAAPASSPALSGSPSVPAQPVTPMTRERFQLERISSFTGLDPNYILYELSLDPAYQLPLADIQSKIHEIEIQSGNDFLSLPPLLKPQDLNLTLRKNPMAAASLLKQQMLRVMGDRLVGAMSLSTLIDYNKVLPSLTSLHHLFLISPSRCVP